jgi:hypothetical protein
MPNQKVETDDTSGYGWKSAMMTGLQEARWSRIANAKRLHRVLPCTDECGQRVSKCIKCRYKETCSSSAVHVNAYEHTYIHMYLHMLTTYAGAYVHKNLLNSILTLTLLRYFKYVQSMSTCLDMYTCYPKPVYPVPRHRKYSKATRTT